MDDLLLRRRQMMASVLPSGYTELEYLENISDSYFDLSQTYGQKTGWRIIAAVQGIGDRGVVFGFDQDYIGSCLTDTGVYFNMNGAFSGTSLDKSIVDMRWESVEGQTYWKVVCVVNGEEHTYNYSRVSYGNSQLRIYQGANYLGTNSFWLGKIYSLKAYKDGVLVHNLIPAKDSNNVCGMYNTVSHAFLTNGASPFTGA